MNQDLPNRTKQTRNISRRAVLNACLSTGFFLSIPRVLNGNAYAVSCPNQDEAITKKSLRISSKSNVHAQKAAFKFFESAEYAYGLDPDNPFDVKKRAVDFHFKDDHLQIMPEKVAIASVMPPTKAGQLHAIVSALYTALHCHGNDGIAPGQFGVDADTILDQACRVRHQSNMGLTTALDKKGSWLHQSRNHLLMSMRLGAGIYTDANEARNAPTLLKESQQGLKDTLGRIARKQAWSFSKGGDYNKNIHKRVAKLFEYVAQSQPKMNRRRPKKSIDALNEELNMLISPELHHRVLRFLMYGKVREGVTVHTSITKDRAVKAGSRLAAAAKAYSLLFPELDLPTFSVFIPFAENAVPEYQIYYSREKKTICIPIDRAFGFEDGFKSEISDLINFRGKHYSLDERLPDGVDVLNGLVHAFNLSVGFSSSATREVKLERGVDLVIEAQKFGVKILDGSVARVPEKGIWLGSSVGKNETEHWFDISKPWKLELFDFD